MSQELIEGHASLCRVRAGVERRERDLWRRRMQKPQSVHEVAAKPSAVAVGQGDGLLGERAHAPLTDALRDRVDRR